MPLKNHDSHRSSGFTLVEILCVVIILGIASAIIVPQIGTRSDLKAAAAARVVMADLLYAQNRAISTQQMHYVKFNTVNQNYTLYSSMATPLTPLTHPVNESPYIVTFGSTGASSFSDCTLTSASFGGQSTIAFDELGTPYIYNTATQVSTLLSGTGTIVITSGVYSLTISIEQDTGDITCQ